MWSAASLARPIVLRPRTNTPCGGVGLPRREARTQPGFNPWVRWLMKDALPVRHSCGNAGAKEEKWHPMLALRWNNTRTAKKLALAATFRADLVYA